MAASFSVSYGQSKEPIVAFSPGLLNLPKELVFEAKVSVLSFCSSLALLHGWLNSEVRRVSNVRLPLEVKFFSAFDKVHTVPTLLFKLKSSMCQYRYALFFMPHG